MNERTIADISNGYGDMQGILGWSMPELDGVEMTALAHIIPEDRMES